MSDKQKLRVEEKGGDVKNMYFTLKLDLSQIFQDARRRSVIVVNTTTMSTVEHVMKKISKILDLQKPFYLAMNLKDTIFYIPPQEEIEILMDEQIYLVLAESTPPKPQEEPKHVEPEKEFTTKFLTLKVDAPESDTVQSAVEKFPVSSTPIVNKSNNDASQSQAMQFFQKNLNSEAVKNCVEIVEAVQNGVENVEATRNGVENVESMDTTNASTGRKRKRVRRRKGKDTSMNNKAMDGSLSFRNDGTEVTAKPKIVHSCILPKSKHIRFDGEVSDTDVSEDSSPKVAKGAKKKNGFDAATVDLMGDTRDVVNGSIKEIEDRDASAKDEKKKEKVDKNERELNIDDRVSFQILRIGDDYTPQISRPIVADVISYSSDTKLYNFRILEGKEETRQPHGKFHLESGVNENEGIEADQSIDIVGFRYDELLHLQILPSIKKDIPKFQNNAVLV